MSWKKTQTSAANELGFSSITELSRLSKVNAGTLSSITRGKRKPSPENAAALIEAIIAKNPDRGLSYIEAASLLCAVLNFLRNHASHIFQMYKVPEINDEDVLTWYPLSPQVSVKNHQKDEETLRLIRLSDTEETLQYILNLAREWEIKHDFELWGKKEEVFRSKQAIISSGLRRAILEAGYYSLVKDIYTEIRHTAHLCEAYEIIIDTSHWLIEQADSISDIPTLVKAKVTLAWTLTSNGKKHPEMLYKASRILDRAISFR